ncbi:hypothetical protein, partial [Streptomyces sp. NPDC087437]|uniref:hypothetical protein n=1 Tax=Streptomyces sp. NPDC087437 TaxID=3365789 RepID=UPI003806B8A9
RALTVRALTVRALTVRALTVRALTVRALTVRALTVRAVPIRAAWPLLPCRLRPRRRTCSSTFRTRRPFTAAPPVFGCPPPAQRFRAWIS